MKQAKQMTATIIFDKRHLSFHLKLPRLGVDYRNLIILNSFFTPYVKECEAKQLLGEKAI